MREREEEFECEHPGVLRRALDEQRRMKDEIRAMRDPDISVEAGPVKFRTRGYRSMDLVLVMGTLLAGIVAWVVWQHIEQTTYLQKRTDENLASFQQAMAKYFSEQTVTLMRLSADIRFQTCVQAVPQNERIMQLRRNSACWFMGQGYDYEETEKARPK